MVRSSLDYFREAALELQAELFGQTSDRDLGDRIVNVIIERTQSNCACIFRPDFTGRFLILQSLASKNPDLIHAFQDLFLPLAPCPEPLMNLSPVLAFKERRPIGPSKNEGVLKDQKSSLKNSVLPLLASMASVPIFVSGESAEDEREGERVFGVLAIDFLDLEGFPEDFRENVEQMAGVLGVSLSRLLMRNRIVRILENGREEEHSKEIYSYLSRLLLDIGRLLRDRVDQDSSDVFQNIANTVAFFLGYPVLWIGILPRGETTLRILAIGGEKKEIFERIKISIDPTVPEGRGLVGECARNGGPREADLLTSDPRFHFWREHFRNAGVESALVDQSWLRRGDRLFLGLYRKRAGPFSGEIAELASNLVRDLGAFLDRYGLIKDRDRLEASQKALKEFQRDLLSLNSPQVIFDRLVQILARITDVQGVLLLAPDEKAKLSVVASSCRTTALEEAAHVFRNPYTNDQIDQAETLPGKVFSSRLPQETRNPSEFPEFVSLRKRFQEIDTVRAAMAWPIGSSHQQPIGVLLLWSDDTSYFSPEIAASFEEVATALFMGLDRLSREEDLRRLSLVARKTNDGILLLDKDGRIVWANPSFVERFGYSLEVLYGRSPTDFLLDIADVEERHRIHDLFNSGISFDQVLRCRSADDHFFWVRLSATVLLHAQGGPDGLVCIASDVTTLKESEFRARVASVFYQALSETMKRLMDLEEPEESVLDRLCETLRDVLGASIVFLGRTVLGRENVEKIAYSGPEEGMAGLLSIVDRMIPKKIRGASYLKEEEYPRCHRIGEPDLPNEVCDWERRFEVVGGLTAYFVRKKGDLIILEAFFPGEELLEEEAGRVFQRIAGEVATYLDRKEERLRRDRLDSYRAALQLFSRQLLSAGSEEDVFRQLVRILSERTDTLAVDCLVPEGEVLVRKFIGGSLSSVIETLPPSVPTIPSAAGFVPTPTRAFSQKVPVFVRDPASDPRMLDLYRTPPFESIALVAAFPIAGARPDDAPLALVILFFSDSLAFEDILLMDLVGDILDHASRSIERMRLLEKLENLSLHDPLTGLLNRRGLGLLLPQLLATITRRKERVLLGILDLDDFKEVNDSYGHAAGDELLVAVGERLRKSLRAEDLVARFGGDEFVVVFQIASHTDGQDDPISAAMERVGDILARPYLLLSGPSNGIHAAISMGFTVYPDDTAEPDGLIRHADEALYVSKRQKEDRSRWWSRWSEMRSYGPPPDPLASTKALLFSETYGEEAKALLERASGLIETGAKEFSGIFYGNLATEPRIHKILKRLSPAEFEHLRKKQEEHIREILRPELTALAHRAVARSLGRIHAMLGISPADMVEAMRIYLTTLQETIRKLPLPPGDRTRLLGLVTHRSGVELSEQVAGMEELDRERRDLIVSANETFIGERSGSDFIRTLLKQVVNLEGIASAILFLPMGSEHFIVAHAAGIADSFIEFDPPFRDDGREEVSLPPALESLLKKAWDQKGRFHVPALCSSSDLPEEFVKKLLSSGFRSLLLLPVRDQDEHPLSILLLGARWPGYFETSSILNFENGLMALLRQEFHRFEARGSSEVLSGLPSYDSLRTFLSRKSLYFEYQPVVDFSIGTSIKIEGLARLVTDRGRIVTPNQFLGAFGRSELIELFRQGLLWGLSQIKMWENQKLILELALNLPPVLLFEPNLVEWVDQAIKESGIPYNRLHFELLTSEEMRDEEIQVKNMNALSERGVRLEMADLGSGFSSLLRLQTLPFTVVKIDQGLFRGHSKTPARMVALIGSLVKLVQGLGFTAVIEGLEDPDLIEAVRILGADGGQGFALSRPMSAEMIPLWMQEFSLPPIVKDQPRSELGRFALEWLNREKIDRKSSKEPFIRS